MNLEREIKINKILMILLITLSVGTIALRTSHAMFSKKETFNNVLRIITGNELPSKSAADDLIKKSGVEGEGLQGINPETGTLCNSNCKEYRYTGPTVKNYVKLNNNNQDELWRIIGVFTDEDTGEKYMRIVRDEVLPESYLPLNFVINGKTYRIKYLTDSAVWNGITFGNNNWAAAGLQYYLNNEQDSSGTKGYMSYLSDETKSMLRETKHYLGTYMHKQDTTVTSYQHERDVKSCVDNKGKVSNSTSFPTSGCNVWHENAATWPGKISLMYPSDVGFAANNSYWNDVKLFDYNGAEVKQTTWMIETMANSAWLISPSSEDSYYATGRYMSGYIFSTPVLDYNYPIRPVLNIKSNVKIKDGTDGSKTNPYIFAI